MIHILALVVSIVLTKDARNYCCAAKTIEFEPVQFYKTAPVPVVLLTTEAISLVHCASVCLSTSGCVSFDFRCQSLLKTTAGVCNVLSNTIHSASQLVSSDQCFVQRKTGSVGIFPLMLPPMTTVALSTTQAPTTSAVASTTTTVAASTTQAPTTSAVTSTTTTVAPSTTQAPSTSAVTSTTGEPVTTSVGSTTTTVPTTTIPSMISKGLFYNEIVWETASYVMLTDNEVLVYRNLDGFGTGDNTGPYPLDNVLGSYNDLPSMTDVDCAMYAYSVNRIELYSGGKVYLWDGYLNNIYTSGVDVGTYLGSDAVNALTTETIQWCVYRHNGVTSERFFGLTSNRIFVTSDVYADQMGDISSSIEFASQDVNVWKDLPDDVIAVANKYGDLQNRFVVITGNSTVYEYIITGTSYALDYLGPLVV